MTPSWKHFRVDTSLEDRVTIWIDVADRSVNVLFEAVFDELDAILENLCHFASTLPLLFRSAKKKGFVVGADLRRILAMESDSEIQAFLLRGQMAFTRLEAYLGNTIAVIQGPCLGGGLELAMACDHRIAMDSPSTQFGTPESKLGLIPGWGGTQRLIEIVGVEKGLPMLIDGEAIGCDRALEIHLIDAILNAEDCEVGISELIKQWTTQKVAAIRGRRIPSNTNNLSQFDAWQSSCSGELTPAQAAICNVVETGLRGSREAGFQCERESFFPLLNSPAVREKLQRFAGGGKKPSEA